MPIRDPHDAEQLDKHLRRFFKAPDGDRAGILRQLFVGEMDFEPAQGSVPLQPTPQNVHLPETGDRIAMAEGFNVVYIRLDIDVANPTNRVRKAEVVQVAKQVSSLLGEDMVLLIANPKVTQLHFILPTFETATPSLRRMVIERDLPRRTAVQQLSNCYFEWQEKTLRRALQSAYDIEAVTRDFFEDYRAVFEAVEKLIEGFGTGEDEQEARHLFTQTLFNRLMFVYFISRKGWLSFNGQRDYLNQLWRAHLKDDQCSTFYVRRLQNLYFAGLNNPQCRDLNRDNPALHALIGDVKFLNGGLFDRTAVDQREDITVPDAAIHMILNDESNKRGLFNRYNFTVMESTPYDVEVAVDPEMLGKVFEELVTGRHESGSYYTPKPVVSFMCREALKGYLLSTCPRESDTDIARFIDAREANGLTDLEHVYHMLKIVKTCDPACGSGAYLLGMMHELLELRQALFAARGLDAITVYNRKLEIIQNCLYGADIDDFAVNIAMLRLWLSLAIDFEGDNPPPLPNLDFKIVIGDSLTSPLGKQYRQGSLFSGQLAEKVEELRSAKASYLSTPGPEKESLRANILSLESEVGDLQGSDLDLKSIRWDVQFSDIIVEGGGFDIVLANPPYVNMVEMDITDSAYRELLRAMFDTATGGYDLFVPFFERGFDLAKSGGIISYITPNKLLSAEYASHLRNFILANGEILSLSDLSNVPVFSAAVYPIVTVVRSGKTRNHRQIAIHEPLIIAGSLADMKFRGLVPDELLSVVDNLWSPALAEDTVKILPALMSSERLDALAEITGAASVSEAYEWKEAVLNEGDALRRANPERYAPFIVSGNVRPHYHTWHSKQVRYIKDSYREPVIDLTSSSVKASRVHQIRSHKVIVSGMSKRPTAFWDDKGIAAGKSTILIVPHSGIDGRYIAALLNSNVMARIYRVMFGSLSLAGGYMRFGPPQLRALPVPSATDDQQKHIGQLVEALTDTEESGREGILEQLELRITELYGVTAHSII